MATKTGIEVENIRALFSWTNDTLKAEITSRKLLLKLMLVKLVHCVRLH